jgi:hypothetical protein
MEQVIRVEIDEHLSQAIRVQEITADEVALVVVSSRPMQVSSADLEAAGQEMIESVSADETGATSDEDARAIGH